MKRTAYEQAAAEYKAFYGKVPTVNEMNDLYHRYAADAKHFNGFTDWLIYHQ